MKVLFICSTNICRSPYCEMYFRRLVERDSELKAIVDDVKSGAVINLGGKLDKKAYACMSRQGFPKEWLDAHRSKHIIFHPKMFREADVIIGMTRIHGWVLPPSLRKKYVNLSEAAEGVYKAIPDPFLASTQEDYDKAMDVIANYLDEYAGKLKSASEEC